jgi:phosphatidylglycerophosphate synthase
MPDEGAPDAGTAKADVYSAGERAWMVRTQEIRAAAFGPLLRAMARAGLQPDHLTLLSLLAGIAFCPLYFAAPGWALIALAAHVALDGLDGPLARHLGVASRKGSFTDSMADQAVIVATAITLMAAGVIGWLPGVLYLITYTVVVLFAMARNALRDPYSWLLRPRFYVYVWYAVEEYWWKGSIDYLLWACVFVLALKVLTGFRGIRRNM